MAREHQCIFFDVETGGLLRTHPIIQLAAVVVDMSTWKEVEVYDKKLQFNPANCEPKALEVNHFTKEGWEDAIPETTCVFEFGAFLNKYTNVRKISRRGSPYFVARVSGHNITSFDLERVTIMFKRYNKFLAMDYSGALDTLRLAAWVFYLRQDVNPPPSYKLVDLVNYFDIKVEGKLHTAITDVRANVQVAKCLMNLLRK